jgi:hypothetical protein
MKTFLKILGLLVLGWLLHVGALEVVDLKAAGAVNQCITDRVSPADCPRYQFSVLDKVIYWRPELYCYSSDFWKFVCRME